MRGCVHVMIAKHKATSQRRKSGRPQKKQLQFLSQSLFQTFRTPKFWNQIQKEKIWLRTKRRSLQLSPTPHPTRFLFFFFNLFAHLILGFCFFSLSDYCFVHISLDLAWIAGREGPRVRIWGLAWVPIAPHRHFSGKSSQLSRKTIEIWIDPEV